MEILEGRGLIAGNGGIKRAIGCFTWIVQKYFGGGGYSLMLMIQRSRRKYQFTMLEALSFKSRRDSCELTKTFHV